jgi:hypothetical protein
MRLPLLTLSVLSTTLLACSSDEPPTPTEVRTALREDLAHVLREGQAALEATATLPTGGAFGFATVAIGGADGATARALAPIARRISERVAAPSRERQQNLDETEDGDVDTDAMIDELEQELFTDANYLGNGVYRVPASFACKTSTYDDTTGETITSTDPDCAAQLDQTQLRIRVAGDGDGIRFFVQIDANHDEPLSLYLAHDELAVTVNLDDATDAMIAMALLLGEEAPNADLSGEVTGSVHVLGTAHARLALSFDRPVSIEFADQGVGIDTDAAYRFASAAGEIVGVELDASAPSGRFDLGLGATTVHIPGDELDPASRDIALGGATVNASFQGSALSLENISLGTTTTTVSVSGQTALTIDLNPADGRTLNATITADPATGDETLEVSPRFDLQTNVDHALLGDDVPTYDTTRVQIDGSLRGTELSGQTEVLSGSVTVTTSPAEYGFAATAGQCIQATEVYDDSTFQSYMTYAVGACL